MSEREFKKHKDELKTKLVILHGVYYIAVKNDLIKREPKFVFDDDISFGSDIKIHSCNAINRAYFPGLHAVYREIKQTLRYHRFLDSFDSDNTLKNLLSCENGDIVYKDDDVTFTYAGGKIHFYVGSTRYAVNDDIAAVLMLLKNLRYNKFDKIKEPEYAGV